MEPQQPSTDHDLLIALNTTVGFIRTDIKDLKDGLSGRVATLEVDKIGRAESSKLQADALSVHVDHENRIRSLEKNSEAFAISFTKFQTQVMTWGSAALLVLGVFEFLAPIILKRYGY